ncbi:MAG: valine--tRNA ligase [Acidobacteria bacterium]|nr:MAG: valine--tRNA ligase [Acidobacteriota bacterium]
MPKPDAFPKVYDPVGPESHWYDVWEGAGYFRPEINPEGEPYCIVIPPPNVTGSLHMGHAFEHSLIDATIRRKRMQGYAALWLPGTDHAGIATQNVVERQLAEEGLSRHDLGRASFLERVWAWKEKSGGEILTQMRRMGDSCDWSRERFTMDEDLSLAVRTVFVQLYEEGLIYRGERIINWCPRCHTAISDIEVDYDDVTGEMVEITYPWADGSPGGVTVATTRAETMLGDSAVAVNPSDERYATAVGRTVTLPLQDREIPIVADPAIDPEFGTGAVKVTPGHDPTDFEIGERHGLEIISIFDNDAVVNENGGAFCGQGRFEAREAVKSALEEAGLLVSVEQYVHSVGHCQRCSTQVEPIVSKQWFVKVRPLSDPALEAVLGGQTKFVPERWVKVFKDWLENIRDWCVSRQLWWGHRIPVWYCSECPEHVVSIEAPTQCAACGASELEQDPDVLDTWFSSALWPFSTLGWPKQTEDLNRFYPNAMLHTGFDIIFFWVARMMQMGIHFMGEVPFHDVAYHGLVRDAHGKKMSKSFGNVVDPLELAGKYSADALRFALVRAAFPGQDVPLAEEWVEGARNFINKLWNASRFVSINLDSMSLAEAAEGELPDDIASRWIMSRLGSTIDAVDSGFDKYNFAEAMRELHSFAWGDFCDWYIELSKEALADETRRRSAQRVLARVMSALLRLLHPVIPFVTEEIWHRMEGGGHVAVAEWPEGSGLIHDEDAESAMSVLTGIVTEIRTFRALAGMPPSAALGAAVRVNSPHVSREIKSLSSQLVGLARLSSLDVRGAEPADEDLAGSNVRLVTPGAEIYIAAGGGLDLGDLGAKLDKKIAELRADLTKVERKLANPEFINKAPEEVVAKERAKLAEHSESLGALEHLSASLSS